MEPTVVSTTEIRVYFTLQNADGTATATRYLAIPGEPSVDTRGNAQYFKQYILQNMNQFVQPSTWRDSTGSSIDAEDATAPWTTTDVAVEVYSVTKTRYND